MISKKYCDSNFFWISKNYIFLDFKTILALSLFGFRVKLHVRRVIKYPSQLLLMQQKFAWYIIGQELEWTAIKERSY